MSPRLFHKALMTLWLTSSPAIAQADPASPEQQTATQGTTLTSDQVRALIDSAVRQAIEANNQTSSQLKLLSSKVDTIENQNTNEALSIIKEIRDKTNTKTLEKLSDDENVDVFQLSRNAAVNLSAQKFDPAREKIKSDARTIAASLSGFLAGRKSTETAWAKNEQTYVETIKSSLQSATRISLNSAIERQVFSDMVKHMDLFSGEDSIALKTALIGGGGVTSLISGISIAVRGDEPISRGQGIALASGAIALCAGSIWELLQKNETVDKIANAVARNQAFANAARSIESQAAALAQEENECLKATEKLTDEVDIAESLADCMSITSRRVLAYTAGTTVLRGYLTAGGIGGIHPNAKNSEAVKGYIDSLESKTLQLKESYEKISTTVRTDGARLRSLRKIQPARTAATLQMEQLLKEMRAAVGIEDASRASEPITEQGPK
ncbi:hypothetical protein NR800_03370 [Corallococcus interemptor]|uniref:hypothetical protein n=1 Tax=Corallococcus interemptor TaxID=2316720 RepID=UPI0035D4474F